MSSLSDRALQDRFEAVRGDIPIKMLAILCGISRFRMREWLASPCRGSKKAAIKIEAWVVEQEMYEACH